MSNNKQSEEEINKIDVQSAADQQENTNADSKKANWRFGAVGNIVKQHLDREGIVRYGTKAFSGGTKVYLDGKGWSLEKDTVAVIGRNRFGRYVIENVPVALVENVRMQRIYKPTVLKIIDREEIEEGWIWWKRTSADKKAAMEFVDAWISKDESGKTRTDLFNECDELEHIIDDLRTGKKHA